jgi:sRNA-binding carbon storage regulator CsrA
MLVLHRKPGQRIRINGTTDVVVLGIRDGQVELGVEGASDAFTEPED